MTSAPESLEDERATAEALNANLTPEQWKIAARSLSVMGVLSTASMVGAAFSFYLINHYPLLLVAMSPIGRHLILAVPNVDPVAFVIVATVRRLIFYAASFHLGEALGVHGIVWLEARAARTGRFIRWLERLFHRFSYRVVFLFPGPAMSSIAGMSGMDFRFFIAVVTSGLILRMILMVLLGEWLREPLEFLLELADEYWVEGTVIMVLGVGLFQWYQRRKGLWPYF